MVQFSDSFKEFLNDQKQKGSPIARLIMNALRYSEYYSVYQNVLTTKEVDYITMRADGLLSYLPAGKTHKVNDRGEWMRDGRQSGKPAKVIRKIFNEKVLKLIDAKSFESFGNAYKAKFMDNGFTFEMKPNSEIPDVYDMPRAEGDASLNSSCMNGDTEYLEIYKYCKQVRILTLTNKDGLLCGRALVWNLNHKDHGDITFMDRIYVVEDYMYDSFINYAQGEGWWRKSSFRSFDDKTDWVNPLTDETVTMKVKLNTDTEFDRYPYIDTFCYGDFGQLNNYSGGEYVFNNTDGTRDGGEDDEDNHDDEVYDEINQEYINDSDAVYLSDNGDRTYRGIYTHRHNAVEVRTNDRHNRYEWYYENDSHIVEVNGDWYVSDHDDIRYTVDGEYAHCDDCTLCETDGEYYTDTYDLIQSEDGDWYHRDNDDNVVYVRPRADETTGEYVYLPDHEDDVIQVDNVWYWKDDKRLEEIELMQNDVTEMVYCIALSSIVKYGRKRYHKDDQRLMALITKKRMAQAA